jgi:hypothetical protein
VRLGKLEAKHLLPPKPKSRTTIIRPGEIEADAG